ncbi:MAG: DNA methyltransferase [Candidatus Binatus sp.]|uniref:site-specific DNA-methyltransferase n=1 Tax=Candidatus Binatus sp. TaxID=2811406 RepID=UPI0027231F36|nr:DNA methyltransferase [Candidatus Binatus sp.]MDO8431321.1 DNA methyltransferase [Candidatus Binatus sp.]
MRNSRARIHQNPSGADVESDQIKVSYLPIAQLVLNARNPRFHSPRQIRQIARSIEAFGFNVPVLIDSKREVIAGHGRVLACKLLGRTEVPTISLQHLSDAQAKAFMIADNRLTENSVWDDRLLAEQLKELSVLDLDFSLEATGFEMGEIDLRIEGLDSPNEADEADDLSELPAGPPVTRLGDLWLLGEHRVYCGSALDAQAYAALMGAERADLVFTDPPYNVPIAGNVSGLGTVRHREFKMASGEMSEAEFTNFLTQALSLLARYTARGSLHFVCMDWRHMEELLTAGRVAYTELKNLCVWAKDKGGMGSLYRSQHELVFVFKNGEVAHRNNVMLGVYGRNRCNLWQYPCATSFSRSGDEGNLLASHPTVKPVALVADAIMDASARRSIVLDGFLGSGTTVIAAERTGRRCFGLELDPLYVDTIVRRWQTFTRNDARHASSGKSFAELEIEVRRRKGCGKRKVAHTK